MKILIASVTNQNAEVLTHHIRSVRALEIPDGVDVEMHYVVDGLDEAATEVLTEAGVRLHTASPKPEDAEHAVSEEGHHWTAPTFHWLAHEKQRLLDAAVTEDFDAVFLVDSDLVLGPETLTSLIEAEKDIVSAVFWTKWSPEMPELPQVWLTHPYEFSGRSEGELVEPADFIRRLSHRELMEVGGLGACTLVKTHVLDRVSFFPIIEGLPQGGMWEGEDRTFCIRAQRHHLSLWADAWPDILHLYRPSDLSRIDEETPKRLSRASVGDWVSATLEPLEEPELTSYKLHLRGRLGQLRILPEIEHALLTTPVGEEAIVKVDFPQWWEVEPYRGMKKCMRLRVLDVKEGVRNVSTLDGSVSSPTSKPGLPSETSSAAS